MKSARSFSISGRLRAARYSRGRLALTAATTLVLLVSACGALDGESSPRSISPVTKTVTASPSTADPAPPPGGPAANAQAYQADSGVMAGYYFVTPSGKWRCAIIPGLGAAGCQPSVNTRPDIGVPGAPAQVPSTIPGSRVAPNAIQIRRGAEPEFAYRGQAQFWRRPLDPTTTLPYGVTLSADQFDCNVQEGGTSCKDQTTGKGFTFSDVGYSWTYTPVGSPVTLGNQGDGGSDSASADFGGRWVGHGRSLELNSDGGAVVRLFSGAVNGSTWNATWAQGGSGLTVTFGDLVQRIGDGASTIPPGTVWHGSMTVAEGVNVLAFDNMPTVYWCREPETGTGVCGA